jgi:hypothetical protein
VHANFIKALASVGILALMAAPALAAGDHPMGFFVTSAGMGNGAGPEAAGSKGRTWWAYLSTQVEEGRAVSARDRIGSSPWYNARSELIAVDLDQLHINPNIVKRTALDANGNQGNGRGDKPNRHDLLTGSKDYGTAYFLWEEGGHTCSNWTSSGEGSA